MPHSSVQTTSKLPSLSGVTRIVVVSPGTASDFSRNCGTQNEWRTSFVWILNSTGRSTGSTSSLASSFSVGYWKVQVNCWPVTFTTISFGCLASMSSSVIQP